MKIKKVINIVLVLMILVIPFCNLLNVGAEEIVVEIKVDENKKATNTASIILNGIKSDTFGAYKVLDVYYDSASNEVTYKFTDLFSNFQKSTYGVDFVNMSIDEYVALGENTDDNIQRFDSLVTSFAKYIRALESAGTSITAIALDTADGTAKALVEVGSYLILSSDVADRFLNVGSNRIPLVFSYSAIIANVTFTASANEWMLSDCELEPKGYPKDGNTFMINCLFDTTVDNFSDFYNQHKDDDIFYFDMSFYKNKEYTYYVAPVTSSTPEDPARLEILFPTGVSIDSNKIYYNETINDDGDTVDVALSGNKVLNNAGVQIATLTTENVDDGVKVVIDFLTYSNENLNAFVFGIKLNDNALIGDPGNIIKSTLYYLKDKYASKPSTWAEYPQLTFENTITTYDLQITNKDATDNSFLSGGVFDVYSDSAYTNKLGTITISSDGTGVLSGVIPGEYYLKQVKAPTGYRVAQSLDKVTVGDDKATTNVDILSTKAGLLPSTGGLGTILYTSFGLLVVALGSIAFISYRKRQVKN